MLENGGGFPCPWNFPLGFSADTVLVFDIQARFSPWILGVSDPDFRPAKGCYFVQSVAILVDNVQKVAICDDNLQFLATTVQFVAERFRSWQKAYTKRQKVTFPALAIKREKLGKTRE